MKNFGYLLLAVVFFAVAAGVYMMVAQDGSVMGGAGNEAVRSARKMSGGGSDIKSLLTQYQPYLSVASSVGGILSFLMHVRVWMRARH